MNTRPPTLLIAAIITLALGLTSCTPTTPLVPQELVTAIEEDGREHTYDVAWQNTRLLVVLVDQQSFAEAEALGVELAARLHRLEKARAEDMSDRATSRSLQRLEQLVDSRSPEANLVGVMEAANKALELFDLGDFSASKDAALEVVVAARWLGARQ